MYPVPAGIKRPTITFSFKPWSLSTLPFIAASVRTFVVSWNEAADINELVCRDALVIPNNTLSASAGFFPSFFKFSFVVSKSILSESDLKNSLDKEEIENKDDSEQTPQEERLQRDFQLARAVNLIKGIDIYKESLTQK